MTDLWFGDLETRNTGYVQNSDSLEDPVFQCLLEPCVNDGQTEAILGTLLPCTFKGDSISQ